MSCIKSAEDISLTMCVRVCQLKLLRAKVGAVLSAYLNLTQRDWGQPRLLWKKLSRWVRKDGHLNFWLHQKCNPSFIFPCCRSTQKHKVFSVQGHYPVIRAAFRARGWIEQRIRRPSHLVHRCHSNESKASSNDAGDSDEDAVGQDKSKKRITFMFFCLD